MTSGLSDVVSTVLSKQQKISDVNRCFVAEVYECICFFAVQLPLVHIKVSNFNPHTRRAMTTTYRRTQELPEHRKKNVITPFPVSSER
jgi:hypothetical protein